MTGRIVSKDNNGNLRIALMPKEEDGCKACSMGDSCSLTKTSEIEVEPGEQTAGLYENDMVDVEIEPKKIVWLSALVYIMPLFAMLAGALAGSAWGETYAIFGALGALGAAMALNIFLNRHFTFHEIITVRRLK